MIFITAEFEYTDNEIVITIDGRGEEGKWVIAVIIGVPAMCIKIALPVHLLQTIAC